MPQAAARAQAQGSFRTAGMVAAPPEVQMTPENATSFPETGPCADGQKGVLAGPDVTALVA